VSTAPDREFNKEVYFNSECLSLGENFIFSMDISMLMNVLDSYYMSVASTVILMTGFVVVVC